MGARLALGVADNPAAAAACRRRPREMMET
jgi:hypothetical protein